MNFISDWALPILFLLASADRTAAILMAVLFATARITGPAEAAGAVALGSACLTLLADRPAAQKERGGSAAFCLRLYNRAVAPETRSGRRGRKSRARSRMALQRHRRACLAKRRQARRLPLCRPLHRALGPLLDSCPHACGRAAHGCDDHAHARKDDAARPDAARLHGGRRAEDRALPPASTISREKT